MEEVLIGNNTFLSDYVLSRPSRQLHIHYHEDPKIHVVLNCHLKQSSPVTGWSGPEGSRKLFPDFMTTAQDDGKVVSRTHRPPLPPGNAPGTHFC